MSRSDGWKMGAKWVEIWLNMGGKHMKDGWNIPTLQNAYIF
jgi:hypothetical protein